MPSIYLLFNKPAGFPFYFITGTIPPAALKDLDDALSYTVKSSDYAMVAVAEKHANENIEREKRGEKAIEYAPWDGKTHFLKTTKNGKKLYIPTGLKQKAIDILAFHGIGVTTKESYNHEHEDVEFSWNGPGLRDYQVEAAKRVIFAHGGIIVVPTGGGKSLIGLKLTQIFRSKTLILVHKHEIFTQWCDSIKKVFGLTEVVSYGDGIAVFVPGNIVVATVQTMYSGLMKKNPFAQTILESPFDLVIFDELHHYSCRTFYAVATKIDARAKIGMTATPNRSDGEDMKFQAAVGSIVYVIKPEELIGDGYLTKPVFEFLEVPEWGVTGRTYQEIYSSGVVHNESRNMAICERVRQLVEEGRQVYIHVERIIHGQILSRMMKAPFVSSKSKNRDETVDTFRKGYTRVLISTLLSEGVDISSVSSIILASGGKSEIAVIQRIGRALRPDPKFNNAIIVDFADRGRYLGEHALARYSLYVQTYGEDIVRNRRK